MNSDWTTDKPTKPGWYWWRPTNVSISPEIVSVQENGNVLLVYDKRIYRVDSMIYGADGEWAGPLEPPV